MTPKEAIERLKHWPEMTELEKLHWLRAALRIKEAMAISAIRGQRLGEEWEDYIKLYEAILLQAGEHLRPTDGELWEVWREFFC